MPDEFPYDDFLSHSAKDKAVLRPLAERLRADGIFKSSQPSTFNSQLPSGPFRFRDPLNKKRRFLPPRLDDSAGETLPSLTQQARIVAEPGKETYSGGNPVFVSPVPLSWTQKY